MKKLNCLRCGTEMRFLMQEKLQLGQTGWILGDLGNLVAGALEVTIMVCPDCGKLEFFSPKRPAVYDEPEPGTGIAEISCPFCGMAYEMDSPKCPYCGEKNSNW